MLFSLKNIVFTVFSCIIKNHSVLVWYNHMPFFSNVEAQVSPILLHMTGLVSNNNGLVFNGTDLVSNMKGLVSNMKGYDWIGLQFGWMVFIMTGHLIWLEITELVSSMTDLLINSVINVLPLKSLNFSNAQTPACFKLESWNICKLFSPLDLDF